MKSSTTDLLNTLRTDVQSDIDYVKNIAVLPLDKLNFKKEESTWSVLENLEHLNLYGDFYIPEMEKAIQDAQHTNPQDQFSSSWLGEYFANAMLPQANGKIKKMKTFKSKDPKSSNLTMNVVDRFLGQQNKLLRLIDDARKINMRKAKCGTTIATWIKVNLGDILRVVVYHDRRHVKQIETTLKNS